MAYDNLKYTDDAVIISNIVADTDSENYLYLDEINRISLLCKSSGLLLNPTETTGATPPPKFWTAFSEWHSDYSQHQT